MESLNSIIVYAHGDWSVGIPSTSIVIDGLNIIPEDEEHKKEILNIIADAFTQILDEKVEIYTRSDIEKMNIQFYGE
jgi:hypothetical protein